MFTRSAMLLITSLLAASGCADDRAFITESDDLDTGAVDSADEGAEDTAEGSDPTALNPEDEPPPQALLACDLELACDDPLELVRDEAAKGYATSDQCALKSLAGGAVELVQTVAVFADAEAYLDHVVVDHGLVLRQAHGRSDDLGIWQKEIERCRLSDADFFDRCLSQFDPNCLDPDQWIVAGSCEPLGSLTCPAP
jgi:hypothetical protein